MTPRSRIDNRILRGLVTAFLVPSALALHLAIQRIAPPPRWVLDPPLGGVVPFLPASVWVYLLLFPLLVATAVLVPRRRFVRLLAAWTLASVSSWSLILLVPVSFERPQPSDIASSLYTWVFELVHRADPAHVSFPCLHAALTFLCYFALRDRARPLPSVFLILSLAIAASTLTTRQHLVLDNVAGFLIALVCARLTLHSRLGAGARSPPIQGCADVDAGADRQEEDVARPRPTPIGHGRLEAEGGGRGVDSRRR